MRGGRLQNLSTPVERIAATSCARFRPGAGRGVECSTSPTLFGPTVRSIAARQRPGAYRGSGQRWFGVRSRSRLSLLLSGPTPRGRRGVPGVRPHMVRQGNCLSRDSRIMSSPLSRAPSRRSPWTARLADPASSAWHSHTDEPQAGVDDIVSMARTRSGVREQNARRYIYV